jgi:hypothetical protein
VISVVALTLLTAIAALSFGLHSSRFVIVELIWIVGLLIVNRLNPTIDRWHRGADGEVLVGGVIESMYDEEWRALHDVSFGGANIDHVVFGPAGVFTIETKSHAGRIPVKTIDRYMLKQAYAEKKKLEEITALHVEPLLVFSRAYLVGKVPCRQEGVMVLPARMLAAHLERRRRVYTLEQVETLHRRLATALTAAD